MYMIHATKSRMWYVNRHLTAQMRDQGLRAEQVIIWNDDTGRGNLASFVDSLKWLGKEHAESLDVWHLQDDVILCEDFVERASKDYKGVVCGFCSKHDDLYGEGYVTPDKMCWSFPCIRIPNKYSLEFVDWVESNPDGMKAFIEQNKNDDLLFKEFLMREHPDEKVLLLTPHLVDHVDYLIGGSVINRTRYISTRAKYFTDTNLVDELEARLKARGK